jgi:hypothetical protein
MIRTLIVLATAALAFAATALAVSAPKSHQCGTVKGVHWTLKGQSGSTYKVNASGPTSCAFARAAVPKLTNANTHAARLSGTPKGFTCAPLISEPSGAHALAGICAKGDNPLNGTFSWAPVGLHI